MLQDCSSVHGMFLLSPVDGVDPFGLIDETCISPPSKLNFHTPALVISGGLDSVPGLDVMGGLFPACAPEVGTFNVKLHCTSILADNVRICPTTGSTLR